MTAQARKRAAHKAAIASLRDEPLDRIIYVATYIHVKLSWDEAKRRATLDDRGLDFAAAAPVFEGMHFTRADLRYDYGEERYVTAGFLNRRLVVLVWTPRDGGRHIISMRKANEREQKAFAQAAGIRPDS